MKEGGEEVREKKKRGGRRRRRGRTKRTRREEGQISLSLRRGVNEASAAFLLRANLNNEAV